MSLINQESWMMFAAHNGDDTANTAMRNAINSAFNAIGYETFREIVDRSWIIRPHPVYPDRQALVPSAPVGLQYQFAIRKRVGDNASTVIGGFSLFVPSGFVASSTGDRVAHPFLAVSGGAIGSALNKIFGTSVADEIFRVRGDLQIGYGTEVQSSRKITPGKMSFFEYRITQSEIRVWMDDALVLQKNVAVNNSTICFATVNWTASGPGTSLGDLVGRWAIADWYNLKEDAVTPNVRLGPTTRVIGTRAATDNFVQFVRPPTYASNAAVVRAPFNPDSGDVLKTDTVGTRDIYDGYTDAGTATAVVVHAMTVRAIAQNIDTVAHTIKPIIVSNGTEQGTASLLGGSAGMHTTVSTIDPNTGAAWTPAAAAIAKFGVKLES